MITVSLVILVDSFRKGDQRVTDKQMGYVLGKQFIDAFEQM